MYSAHCHRAIQGWFAGCWVATAVLCVFAVVALASTPGTIDLGFAVVVVFLLPLVFVVICMLTGIPAAAVVSLSEQFRIRSVLFFGCAGAVIGVITAALTRSLSMDTAPAYLVAGSAAGLVYWYVAGKHAGEERSDDRN